MKRLILLALYIGILSPITAFSADIDGGQTVRGTIDNRNQIKTGPEGSWVNQYGNTDGEAFVRDYSSKLPLANTTFVKHKATGAISNYQIIDTTPYSNIYVASYSIVSLDLAATDFLSFVLMLRGLILSLRVALG